MKPIHKFNGGLGATLCHKCSVIITTGLTEDLYCEFCNPDFMKDKTPDEWLEIVLNKQGYISRSQQEIYEKLLKKVL